MAKKDKLKLDEFELDDDLNFPGFDFNGEDVPDKRKPVTRVKDSIKAGVKESLYKPSTYASMLRNALPKEYGETYDNAAKIGEGISNTYRDAVKELSPAINDVARSINAFVPDSMRRTKEKLRKLEELGQEPAQLNSQEKNQREDNIALELGKIFKVQMQEQIKAQAETAGRKKIDDALGVIRHRDQMSALNQLAIDMRRMAQYETTITQAYQKKSLELQYRSLYIQADMLELQKKATLATSSRLDAIATNTALPEFLKLRKNEAFRENLRNKFVGAATQGLFSGSEERVNKFFTNLSNSFKETVAMASEALSSAAMGLDMAASSRELSNEKFYETAAREGASSLVTKAASRLGFGIRKKMERYAPDLTRKIDAGAADLRYLKGNWLDILGNFANSTTTRTGLSGTVLDLLKNTIYNNLDYESVGLNTSNDKLKDIRANAVFTNQTQKSVTEVIPGLLTRILREVHVLRTGNEQAGLVEYDYKTNRFTTSNKLAASMKEGLFKDTDRNFFSANFDSYIESLGLTGLSGEERKALAGHLLRQRFSGNGFGVETFTDPYRMNGMSPELANKLSGFFTNYYEANDVDSKDKVLEQKKRRANLTEWGNMVGNELQDPREEIQHYINAGQSHLLRQAGIIDDDGRINVDTLVAKATENVGGNIASDIFLKENIRSFSPQEALQGIRSTAVKLWNYKGSSSADDGRQTHIGPMAQDMQSAFGDAVAPGGKKINLGNMVSAVMAATQAIDEKVRSVGDVLKSQMSMLTAMMSEKAKRFKDGFSATGFGATAEEKDAMAFNPLKVSKDVSLRDRLFTMENLLAMIAANTSGKGVGVGFDRLFTDNGKFSAFRMRWPDLFKARRRTEQDEKKDERDGLLSRMRSSSLASKFGNFAESAADFAGGAFSAASRFVREQWAGMGKNLRWLNRNFVTPGYERVRDIAVSRVKTLRDRLKGIDDIYVEGETVPRMYKAKMLQGFYVDLNTGRIIRAIQDIKGAVLDRRDNSVVISSEEVKNLVLRSTVVSRTIKIGKELTRTIANTTKDFFQNKLPVGWNEAWRIGKKVAGAAAAVLDQARDVYVKGEEKPRLFKFGFKNGLYFLKSSGLLIKRPGQIRDEVIDKDGNTLLSHDDIAKGLVDVNGAAILTTGKHVASVLTAATISIAKKGINVAKELLKTGKSVFGTLTSQGWKGMKELFSNFGIGIGGREAVNVLKEIRDILNSRLPGGKRLLGDKDDDGDRDGSWQDQLSNKKEKLEHKARSIGKKITHKGNIFDDIQNKVTGMIGNLVDGALDLLGIGGLFGKAKGAAAAAEGAAKATQVGAAAAKTGRMAAILSKLKGFGSLAAGTLTGGLLSGAGAASPTLATTVASSGGALAGTAGAAAAAGGSLFARMMRSGTRGAGAVMNAAGRGISAVAPGLVGGALKTANVGLKSAMGVGKGIGMLGKGLGIAGKYGLKMLPGLGVAYGLGSAATNAMAGNYGTAALDLGLASVSGLGLAGTASLLSAALFNPITLGLVAAAGVGYGLYKTYKWITKKKFEPLSIFRMMQYGIGDQDKEYQEKIYNLEKFLTPYVKINGTSAQIAEGKFKVEDMLSIFDIKTDDMENLGRFGEWFQNRFKPVFLTHMAALFRMKGKTDIDLVDTDIKESREKLEYLKSTAMLDGPWGVMTLPFPASPKSVVAARTIIDTAENLRQVFASQIKPGQNQKAEDKSWIGKVFSAAPSNPEGILTNIKVNDNVSETSRKITSLMREDIIVKGGVSAISVGSDKAPDWVFGNTISAFEAVKLKAYGLNKFEQGTVASIRWLETYCLDGLRAQADGTTLWTGKPDEAQAASRRYFGFTSGDPKQNDLWLVWFLKRFLPVYTTVANKVAATLGNENYVSHRKAFNEQSIQALQIMEYVAAMDRAWSVTSTPWSGLALNTNASSTKAHIEWLRKFVKDKELQAQGLHEGPGSQGTAAFVAANQAGAASGAALAEAREYDDYKKRVAASQKRSQEQANKIAQLQKDSYSGMSADEGENKPSGSGSATSQSVNVTAPPAAGGEIASGSGAQKYLKLASSVNLKNMHPSFLKLFLGAVQEYGEKTGKQIQVNEGFRTYEYQAALKRKLGAKAAAPGNSMHEFGLAIDISSADADAMEKLGLLRKYGLTRPVGQEPWHIEPAGIQLAHQEFKKNWQAATAAIESGVGKGGGGYGTIASAHKYGRDRNVAKQFLTASDSAVDSSDSSTSAAEKAQKIAIITSQSGAGLVRTKDGLNIMTPANQGGGQIKNILSAYSEGETPNARASGVPTPGKSGASAMLEQIALGEGTDDAKARKAGFKSGYDVPLGYGKYAMPDKDISSMTLGEVKAYQKKLLAASGNLKSSAVGKYQIVGTTLRELQQKMGLSDDTIFSPQLQDQMGTMLMKRRGLDKYLAGKMSAKELQANMSLEWASIAHPDTGRALQHTGTSSQAFQTALAGASSGEPSAAVYSSEPSKGAQDAKILSAAYRLGETKQIAPAVSKPRPAPTRNNESITHAFLTTQRPAPAPQVQPEIKQIDLQITKSVENVAGILSDSLSVQKSILNTLQSIAQKGASALAPAPQETEPAQIQQNRIPSKIMNSPLSVSNKVLT